VLVHKLRRYAKAGRDRGHGVAVPFKDRGASAVEYGLLIAAVAAVVVGVAFGLGALVNTAFSKTCSSMVAGGMTGGTCTPATPTTTATTVPPAGG
jgi:pilus assembly protein Flp/PilA